MEYRQLGKTGIEVSRLCFGSLTIAPMQANLPVMEGAKIIRHALNLGVNFIDTAELYDNYDIIREGIKGLANDVVIASKCYAYTREGMRNSIEKALKEIDRDYIDIFLLHEQESELTIQGHWEAVEELFDARQKGLVRAVGISTHSIAAVKAASRVWRFDVIHPLVNIKGIGILDGQTEEMVKAIKEASDAGKGLYGMKVLGGGNLIAQKEKAMTFALSVPGLSAIALGMQTIAEVEYNIAFFEGREIPEKIKQAVASQDRKLHIDDWCQGCGSCVERCGQGALSIVNGKAVPDYSLCRLCGYCSAVCSEMCIKII